MKKLVVATLLLISVFKVSGQEDSDRIGVDIRVNGDLITLSSGVFGFSGFNSREDSYDGGTFGVGFGLGFGASAVYNFAVTEDISVAPGLGFSKIKFPDLNLSTNQLEIPVISKFEATEDFKVTAGIKYALFLNNEFKTALDKSGNLSIDAGFVYDMDSNLFFELRYAYGLTKFGDVRISGIQASLGYSL